MACNLIAWEPCTEIGKCALVGTPTTARPSFLSVWRTRSDFPDSYGPVPVGFAQPSDFSDRNGPFFVASVPAGTWGPAVATMSCRMGCAQLRMVPMMLAARVVISVLVIVALVVFLVSYLKSMMGKPFGKTLRVPRGKTSVKVDVFDDRPMRPFRYGQAFDVVLTLPKQTLTSMYTGETRTSAGVISFKGTPVGFMCDTNSFTQTLMKLAEKYPKVIVQAAVMGTDADDRPIMELQLPDTKWFLKALKEREK